MMDQGCSFVRMEPRLIVPDTNEIEFFAYLLILFLLGGVRMAEGQRLGVFLRSFWNPLLIDQQLREERSFNRISLVLIVIMMLIHALFFYLCLRHFQLYENWSAWFLIPALMLMYFVLSAIRMAAYSGFAWVFDMNDFLREYSYHWLLNNFLLGLGLLPISILHSFGPADWNDLLIKTGLILMGLAFIFRNGRMFFIAGTTYRVPLIYNIFYLCGLEFLPLLLLITVAARQG